MQRRNSEAPTTCDSQGFGVSNFKRVTNMKSIANSELNFHGVSLSPVAQMNDTWLTSADLARALGYASSKSVSTIYSRNSDEFTGSMSMVIKMMTNGINNNLREKSVRVFSLRGCHLIAMFATTDKAKEFRRWVLDILDREVSDSPIAKQFTDEELINLSYMWVWMDKSRRVAKQVYPALKQLASAHHGFFYDMANESHYMIDKARASLVRETENIDMNGFHARNAQGMLDRLNGKEGVH
ncbi:P22AR C-terminal domain-containing protein [Rouxiella sp. WC2420]|uniref:P22AR C-terminal domain-containing protein n=1 Tax=Rouxiella sp. WC2420 TaxID=3234145 RepID=A0AB39VMT4_9GAMM